jgi:hypothetical protein
MYSLPPWDQRYAKPIDPLSFLLVSSSLLFSMCLMLNMRHCCENHKSNIGEYGLDSNVEDCFYIRNTTVKKMV